MSLSVLSIATIMAMIHEGIVKEVTLQTVGLGAGSRSAIQQWTI